MLYKASLRTSLVHNLPRASRVIGTLFAQSGDTYFDWELVVVLQGQPAAMLERRGFAVLPVLGDNLLVHSVDLLPSIGVAQHPATGWIWAVFDLGKIAKDETLEFIKADTNGSENFVHGTMQWPTRANSVTRAFRIEKGGEL